MKLLPCPFCGEEKALATTDSSYVGCKNCHADGPCSLSDPDTAIEAWNTRTPTPTVWHRASKKLPTAKDGDFAGAVWMFCQGEDFTTRPYHEISVWARIMAKEIYWARTGITKPKPPEV